VDNSSINILYMYKTYAITEVSIKN